MSKICDCEGADKAYAIINPDSPDRKEILSLPPPICKETVIREGNEIRVDWGLDDIEYLTGSEWDLEEIFLSSYAGGVQFDSFPSKTFPPPLSSDPFTPWSWTYQPYRFHVSGGAPAGIQWRFASEANPDIPYQINDRSCGIWVRASNSAYLYLVASSKCTLLNTLTTVVNGWQRFGTQAYTNFARYDKHPLDSLAGISNDGFLSGFSVCSGQLGAQTHLGWKVTSDTSAVSERNVAAPPNVSLDGGVKVEISDLTGVLEILDSDVPVSLRCGDRECPPETCCNPCEGSALNCCYDENGKLIDSFTRRS